MSEQQVVPSLRHSPSAGRQRIRPMGDDTQNICHKEMDSIENPRLHGSSILDQIMSENEKKTAATETDVYAIHGADPEVLAYAMAKYSRSSLTITIFPLSLPR